MQLNNAFSVRWAVPFLLTLLAFTGCSSGSRQSGGDVAAIVNGTTIPLEDITMSVDNLVGQYKSLGVDFDSTQVDSIRDDILDQFVTTELMYQESQKAGFTPTEEEVTSQLQSIIKQYPSEEMFKTALEKQGITEEKFRTHIAKNTSIKNYIEEKITKQVEVTPEEKSLYYDEHKEDFKHDEEVGAKHILIQTNKDDPADTLAAKKAKIQGLLARIRKGEDFSTLAKEFSDCPSAAKGGDLGYFSRGKMVKPFEDAAFALKVGDVSDVVQTNYGYHIILVYDRKSPGYSTFDEVQDYIDESIRRGKTREELDTVIANLKEKADIQIKI